MVEFEREKGEQEISMENMADKFINKILNRTPLRLEKGYEFATRNPMWLGRAICTMEAVWSPDSKAEFSHAGIIIDTIGSTFEALWTLKTSTLDNYIGEYIIISNNENTTFENKSQSLIKIVREHAGQWYPGWRLLLHLFGPLAKINWFNHIVCSELVAKFEWLAEIRHKQYSGTTPDQLVDEWKNYKNRQVIEGVLKKYNGQYYIKHIDDPVSDISWIKSNPVRPPKEERI